MDEHGHLADSSGHDMWQIAAWLPRGREEEVAQSLFKLVEALEDSDDVQTVYANFDIPDELMAKLEG